MLFKKKFLKTILFLLSLMVLINVDAAPSKYNNCINSGGAWGNLDKKPRVDYGTFGSHYYVWTTNSGWSDSRVYFCVNPGTVNPDKACVYTKKVSTIIYQGDSLEQARAAILVKGAVDGYSIGDIGDALNALSCALNQGCVTNGNRAANLTAAGNAVRSGSASVPYATSGTVDLLKVAFDIFDHKQTLDDGAITMSLVPNALKADCDKGNIYAEIILKVDKSKISNFDPLKVKFTVSGTQVTPNYIKNHSMSSSGYVYYINVPINLATKIPNKNEYKFTVEAKYEQTTFELMNYGNVTITYAEAYVQKMYIALTNSEVQSGTISSPTTGYTNSKLDIVAACAVPVIIPPQCYVDGDKEKSHYNKYRYDNLIDINTFIDPKGYNCCKPLQDNENMRLTTLDKDGKNLYNEHCKGVSFCFTGTNSLKYQHDITGEIDDAKYALECCKELPLQKTKDEMGPLYDKLCVPPTSTCFTGTNSWKDQYAANKIDDAKYALECCLKPGAIDNDKMGKDTFDRLCPSTCFTGLDPLKNKHKNGAIDDQTYADECCKYLDAESEMGKALYDRICPSTCFTGKNSDLIRYNGGQIKPEVFASNCCDNPDADTAKEKMGLAFYNKYCVPNSKCPNLTDKILCTNEPDYGQIYEIEEKGITEGNYKCLISGQDYKGNPFDQPQSEFAQNRYCRVVCKEDADLYFQGFGWNPKNNPGSEFIIRAGTYFKFKPFSSGTDNYDDLPTINQQRSCLSKMYVESFTLDLYGVAKSSTNISTITPGNVTGGFYGAAATAAKQFQDATNQLPGALNALAIAQAKSCPLPAPELPENQDCQDKKDAEINSAQNKIDQLYRQIQSAKNTYNTNVQNINSAVIEMNKCHDWNNEYVSDDLGKAKGFDYFEKKHPTKNVRDQVKDLDLELSYSKIDATDKTYCTNDLKCGQSMTSSNIPLLAIGQLNSSSGVTPEAFLNSLQSSSKLNFYEMSTNETTGDVSYTIGLDLYSLKPTGQVVAENHPDLVQAQKNNTYNKLGHGLPVNIDTYAKTYKYDFEVINLGKYNRLLDLFKDEVIENDKYICNYMVGNQIICPPIECPDPKIECPTCPDVIEDPTTQVFNRAVESTSLDPNKRTLGPNWSDEKGKAAVIKIEADGDDIFLEPAMYTVIIGSKEIKEIREYNKNNTYSNFDLKCKSGKSVGIDGGVRCESAFVEKYAGATANLPKTREIFIEYNNNTNSYEYQKYN